MGSESSYAERQDEMNAEYRSAYEKFVENADEETLERLNKFGLLEPDTSRSTFAPDHEPTIRLLHSPTVSDYAEENHIKGAVAALANQREATLDALRKLLSNIIYPPSSSNPRREAEQIGLAIGMPGLGGMTEVAKRHGVGKAAVSKQVRIFVKEHDLPPSCYMLSESVRSAHRKHNRRGQKAS